MRASSDFSWQSPGWREVAVQFAWHPAGCYLWVKMWWWTWQVLMRWGQ